MEIKRTTEFSIETTRRFVVCSADSPERAVCMICGEPAIAAEAAARLLNLTSRAIYRLIESGAIHFQEIEHGATLVCPSSFAANLTNGDVARLSREMIDSQE
jgi:hypothetical protein